MDFKRVLVKYRNHNCIIESEKRQLQPLSTLLVRPDELIAPNNLHSLHTLLQLQEANYKLPAKVVQFPFRQIVQQPHIHLNLNMADNGETSKRKKQKNILKKPFLGTLSKLIQLNINNSLIFQDI